MNGRLLVIGDALLDREVEGHVDRVAPDAPVPVLEQRASRPGGAGLAAGLAARNGRPVTLLTALASDRGGEELARLLLAAGVDLIDLGLAGGTPERVRLQRPSKPPLYLEPNGPPASVDGTGAVVTLRVALSEADGVLVSDHGRGVAADKHIRMALATRSKALPLVWDPDPNGPPPLKGAALVTPSLAEAVSCAGAEQPGDEDELGELARALAHRWQAERVCITLGPDGALLAPQPRRPWRVHSAKASGERRGAGDMFAAEVASRLADGQRCKDAVTSAVAAATRFVSEGYVREDRLRFFGRRGPVAADPVEGSPSPSLLRALELARRVRKRGGTISATDGRFDVLRRDHVRWLEAAARLGDRLVVLVDSNRSELAPALRALGCVDAVAIFDGPAPLEALRLLRPEVWVRGGDHDVSQLSESRDLPSWGGRVALLTHALDNQAKERANV